MTIVIPMIFGHPIAELTGLNILKDAEISSKIEPRIVIIQWTYQKE